MRKDEKMPALWRWCWKKHRWILRPNWTGPREKKIKHDKDEDVAPEKRSARRSEANVEENMDSRFSCPGDENSFRREKESSDSIIVEHYKDDTLVDFSPTGDQWQKKKSVIFDAQVKKHQWYIMEEEKK